MMTDQEVAARIGLHEVRTLRAVRRVESNGHPDAVRFEPHVFRHMTKHAYDQFIPYTPSNAAGTGPSHVRAETDRHAFEIAFFYDEAAAVRSTSWGAYQELGSILLDLNKAWSPSDAVHAFDYDPTGISEQLIIKWFEYCPRAVAALNNHDWYSFARWYNGPGNASHYADALRGAYEAVSG